MMKMAALKDVTGDTMLVNPAQVCYVTKAAEQADLTKGWIYLWFGPGEEDYAISADSLDDVRRELDSALAEGKHDEI